MHIPICYIGRQPALRKRLIAALIVLSLAISPRAAAEEFAEASPERFPPELIHWTPCPDHPIFTAQGPGHWDVKIRERGWILRSGEIYQLWFTGYDGTREGIKQLGYATSRDGQNWTLWTGNPLVRDHHVEDMMVVDKDGIYYMFAEGDNQRHVVMLTSKGGVDWKWEGPLDIRLADGIQPAPKPRGTPTVWIENGVWYLFYESRDLGVWLARADDPYSRIWINVLDEPVLAPGPAEYDNCQIALDQVVKHAGAYFAFYHSCTKSTPTTWSTNIARSTDLIHWQKYSGNPLIADKSSGIVVPVDDRFHLYTMHGQIYRFCPPAITTPAGKSSAGTSDTRAASPAARP